MGNCNVVANLTYQLAKNALSMFANKVNFHVLLLYDSFFKVGENYLKRQGTVLIEMKDKNL